MVHFNLTGKVFLPKNLRSLKLTARKAEKWMVGIHSGKAGKSTIWPLEKVNFPSLCYWRGVLLRFFFAYFQVQFPQNYHIFAWFDLPKLGEKNDPLFRDAKTWAKQASAFWHLTDLKGKRWGILGFLVTCSCFHFLWNDLDGSEIRRSPPWMYKTL